MFHRTASGRRLAYERLEGQGPGVVFLHGFKSDMGGTKAVDLEAWCRAQGRAMLRFDLSGHGSSEGRVEEFGVGDWLKDARDVIDALAPGRQVLVGSSLGGWLALLLARERPERWAGLVTIAAAPDFTARMQAEFTDADHEALVREGRITRPSEYGEDYVFSRRLFDQGAENSVFGQPLALPMPVRFLQGTADADVPIEDALRLLSHAEGPDIRLMLVKDADHRFSGPGELRMIREAVTELAG
ncbi:alpha/beta fold hydrolase [Paracoccus sp. MC1862]|uniref:alpha/beta fold hydrolase n=1 Tax=Paracoccus sp. MC1862 TaxID=2760307 RepID=UPI0015FEE276|nr:alpha/beta hydrolase [Paracoccus sp. MC1862]MBB1499174.1 alpha/beta hydrolase [Paracoccus sp. MC1862]QQO45789.1 alpha/beta hydrolase [Paracoccus sp. MC1862]